MLVVTDRHNELACICTPLYALHHTNNILTGEEEKSLPLPQIDVVCDRHYICSKHCTCKLHMLVDTDKHNEPVSYTHLTLPTNREV